MTDTPKPATDGFAVTGWMHALGGFIARHPRLWTRLGNLDTRIASEAIDDIRVEAPIYITGLARSGSTILLELLSEHPDTGSHRYRDYPAVFTPWLWDRFLQRVPNQRETAAQRTHDDGIKVTSESPEAFEEMLWMAFFPNVHDSSRSSTVERSHEYPAFERFYTEHIRKLLAIRGARRYLAKDNYNISRLTYLQRLFEDARFVIPVRDPVWHIASLMKQHRLFIAGERDHPRALAHMQRVGHFEFGLDRRAVNVGNDEAIADIEACWARGDEVTGWARYWAVIHNYIADCLESDINLRDATLVLRFEELCVAPREQLARLFEHCALPVDDAFLDNAATRIRAPTYYQPGFSDEEQAIIKRETAAAAGRLDYSRHARKSAGA